MEDDQQFCLRWNNHQATLVAVFDTLLENGTLIDCTLAAEGKYLNAHKVVLSACSPYFETLLSQNYDKHPVFILKDVKFQELKAMMDYMYRGEVNISQDQLGALLKAAESLQIKGLSDNKKDNEPRKPAPPPVSKSPPPSTSLPRVQGLTIEQRRANRNLEDREGSQSPGPRKRKRQRRRSTDDLDNHDASNSSESHSNPPIQNTPIALPPPVSAKMLSEVPEPIESKADILRHKESELAQVPIIKEKIETTHTELMLEPKAEYVEEMNEDSIEDLTLDDDDVSNLDMSNDGAGPSHGSMGDGSGQGFGWHMGNQNQDEVFLAAQEAVGAHRDNQAIIQEELVSLRKDVNIIGLDLKKLIEQHFAKVYSYFKKVHKDEVSNDIPEDKPLAVVPKPLEPNKAAGKELLSQQLLPLTTVGDVVDFEKALRNNDLKQAIINHLLEIICNNDNSVSKLGYILLDVIFSSEVLTQFSWTGVTRLKGSAPKNPFNSFKGILCIFYEVLHKMDTRYTMEKNESFFKDHVLKHASKRHLRKRNPLKRPFRSLNFGELEVDDDFDDDDTLSRDESSEIPESASNKEDIHSPPTNEQHVTNVTLKKEKIIIDEVWV